MAPTLDVRNLVSGSGRSAGQNRASLGSSASQYSFPSPVSLGSTSASSQQHVPLHGQSTTNLGIPRHIIVRKAENVPVHPPSMLPQTIPAETRLDGVGSPVFMANQISAAFRVLDGKEKPSAVTQQVSNNHLPARVLPPRTTHFGEPSAIKVETKEVWLGGSCVLIGKSAVTTPNFDVRRDQPMKMEEPVKFAHPNAVTQQLPNNHLPARVVPPRTTRFGEPSAIKVETKEVLIGGSCILIGKSAVTTPNFDTRRDQPTEMEETVKFAHPNAVTQQVSNNHVPVRVLTPRTTHFGEPSAIEVKTKEVLIGGSCVLIGKSAVTTPNFHTRRDQPTKMEETVKFAHPNAVTQQLPNNHLPARVVPPRTTRFGEPSAIKVETKEVLIGGSCVLTGKSAVTTPNFDVRRDQPMKMEEPVKFAQKPCTTAANVPFRAKQPPFEQNAFRPTCTTSLASLDLAQPQNVQHPIGFRRPFAPKVPAKSSVIREKRGKQENERWEVTMEELAKLPHEQYIAMRSQMPGGNLPEPKPPKCDCPPEAEECGPFYAHMGHAESIQELRAFLEATSPWKGRQIRFEKISTTKKEGKNSVGCPIAKWVIRRSGIEEKLLAVVKHRPRHVCKYAWLVAGYAIWEGIPRDEADFLYSVLSKKLPAQGKEFKRKCGTNQKRTCACQGTDESSMGFSATFGCSFQLYFNTCKYARSDDAKKFRMKNKHEDEEVKHALLELAKRVQGSYGSWMPIVFRHQTALSSVATGCRIGDPNLGPCPFSGVTTCVDFCAHSHKDSTNMHGGLTLVVTLSKNRDLPFGKEPQEEQLHTLPFYALDNWEENGDSREVQRKFNIGALKKLTGFFTRSNIRKVPLRSCRKQAELDRLEGKEKRKKVKETTSPKTPKSAKRRLFSDSQPSDQPSNAAKNPNYGWSPSATVSPRIQEWYPERTPPACQLPSFQAVVSRALNFEPPPVASGPFHTGYEGASVPQVVQTPHHGPYFDHSYHQAAYSPSSFCNNPAAQPVPSHSHTGYNLQRPVPVKAEPSFTHHLGGMHSSQHVHSSTPQMMSTGPTYLVGGTQPNHPLPVQNTEVGHSYQLGGIQIQHPVQPNIASGPTYHTEGFSQPSVADMFPNTTFGFAGVSDSPPPLLDIRWDAQNMHQDFKPPMPVTKVEFPWVVKPVSQVNHWTPQSPYTGHGFQTPDRVDQSWPAYHNPVSCPPVPQATPWQQQGYQNGSAFVAPPKPHYMDRPTLSPSPASSSWPSLPSQPPRPASAPPAEGFEFEVQDSYNVELMQDPDVGGVAIALDHGSIYLEAAKYEVHATTAVPVPNPKHPTRISLVFYQHKTLNYANHGREVMMAAKERKAAAKREAAAHEAMNSFAGPSSEAT